jgi:hypothetical protein
LINIVTKKRYTFPMEQLNLFDMLSIADKGYGAGSYFELVNY